MTVGAARAFHCPYFGKGKPPERSAGGQIAQVQTLLSAQALIVLGQASGSARGVARGLPRPNDGREIPSLYWVVRKGPVRSARVPGVAGARAPSKVRNVTESAFSRNPGAGKGLRLISGSICCQNTHSPHTRRKTDKRLGSVSYQFKEFR